MNMLSEIKELINANERSIVLGYVTDNDRMYLEFNSNDIYIDDDFDLVAEVGNTNIVISLRNLLKAELDFEEIELLYKDKTILLTFI